MKKEFNNLMSYLPYYYQDIQEMIKLQESIELEYRTLKNKIDDLFNQMYILKATWGLILWEKMTDLPVGDIESNFEARREKILAKLTNIGTTTVQEIKKGALIFTDGEIDVIENFAEYFFTIRFTSIVGKAPNIEAFRQFIELNKPAHLGYKIEFRYNTHGELKQHNLTHRQLAAYRQQQIYDTRLFED